ncbi:MAG: phosphoribosylglycinamide formyltransferase [Planctomycetota bacterium]|nr:phosphoribosylglycinamide formyltransferase [Planctomycetota bacterium]
MDSDAFSFPHPVAVMVSGTGRHLDHLAQLASAGELPLDIRLCLSSREGVGALDHAKRWNIPSQVPDAGRELTPEVYGELIFRTLEAAGVQTLILAGFLRFLPIPEAWENRGWNIHPSLLPAFGGPGFYGHHVHEAVLKRGCKVSGCTVHYVDNIFDNGPILVQRTCEVLDDDNEDTLAARVFAEELEAYPEAIRKHLQIH